MGIEFLGASAYFIEALSTLIASLAFTGAVVIGSIIAFRVSDPHRTKQADAESKEGLLKDVAVPSNTPSPKLPKDVWEKTVPSSKTDEAESTVSQTASEATKDVPSEDVTSHREKVALA